MATMQDVATLANVSLSTVSYAINNTRPISAATRERIENAMAQLDFRPHAIARSLASRRSRILALTFPGTENRLGGTIMEFVTSAAQAARERDHHLVVWPYTPDQSDEMSQMSRQGLADGVIVMEVRLDDPRVRVLDAARVPLVMIGRTDESNDSRCVDIDFDATTEAAVGHLADLGHRDIAFLNHSERSRDLGYGPTVRAHRGFLAAMARRGLTPRARWCDESPAAGRVAVGDLLDSEPGVSAVVAMNEDAMFGVLAELSARAVDVPGEISVLSIVSSPRIAEMTQPPLTTLHAPGTELGRLGVERLLDQLENRHIAAHPVLLPCVLEAGGSTAPVSPELIRRR